MINTPYYSLEQRYLLANQFELKKIRSPNMKIISVKADKRADEIVNYVPSEDIWFKHENMGYCRYKETI